MAEEDAAEMSNEPIGLAFISAEVFPDVCPVCCVETWESKALSATSGTSSSKQESEDGPITCEDCGCVTYCSEEHLEDDLPYHHTACDSWQGIRKKQAAKLKVKQTRGVGSAADALDSDLQRATALQALQVHDHAVLQLTFHPACCVCRRSARELLERCEECKVIYWCKSGHSAKEIKHECKEMTLSLACEKILRNCKGRPDISFTSLSPPSHSSSTSNKRKQGPGSASSSSSDESKAVVGLDTVQTWQDFFALRFAPDPILSKLSSAEQAVQSNIYSLALSIAFCYQQLRDIKPELPPLAERSAIRVHVIGGRFPEFISARACEELFHCYPKLRCIHLLLIGPEVDAMDFDDPKYTLPSTDLCDECDTQDRRLFVCMEQSVYHDSPLIKKALADSDATKTGASSSEPTAEPVAAWQTDEQHAKSLEAETAVSASTPAAKKVKPNKASNAKDDSGDQDGEDAEKNEAQEEDEDEAEEQEPEEEEEEKAIAAEDVPADFDAVKVVAPPTEVSDDEEEEEDTEEAAGPPYKCMHGEKALCARRPDFAILPNAGISLYQTWTPTVKTLLRANVPCFVTAHDREDCHSDVEVVKKLGGKVFFAPRLHPFRGLTPVRKPHDLCHVIFRNNFIFGFTKK